MPLDGTHPRPHHDQVTRNAVRLAVTALICLLIYIIQAMALAAGEPAPAWNVIGWAALLAFLASLTGAVALFATALVRRARHH